MYFCNLVCILHASPCCHPIPHCHTQLTLYIANNTINIHIITDTMHIVIIGTAHPYRGGLAAFNERLAAQFRDEGHQVEMYTFTL